MSSDRPKIIFDEYPIENDNLSQMNEKPVDAFSNELGKSGYIREVVEAHFEGEPNFSALSIPFNNLRRRDGCAMMLTASAIMRDMSIIQALRRENRNFNDLPGIHAGRLIHIASKH